MNTNCDPMPTKITALDPTDDAVLGGRLRLLQPRRGHRVGHDAILLAAATAAQPGELAIDLGAGVGAAGLALAQRVPGLKVSLVEIDPDLVGLANENAARNGLAERVAAIVVDVTAAADDWVAAGLNRGSADRVLMNPPFNDPDRQNVSPDPGRRAAHATPRAALSLWIEAAARLLRRGGVLTLIYRADGMTDVLTALGGAFGSISVLPIFPKPAASAIRIVVRAVKGGRAPFALLPGLTLQNQHGAPTDEAEAVLRAGESLPLAASA